METLFAATIIMMSLFLATFQVIRNYKYRELAERRHQLLVILLYAHSFLVLSDYIVGGNGFAPRLVLDLMLVLIALQLLSSSIWAMSDCLNLIRSFIGAIVLLAMYNIMCALSLSALLPDYVYIYAIMVTTMIYAFVFLLGVWYRIREVKAVMQSGTVWACLAFSVDTIYVVIVLAEVAVLISSGGDVYCMNYIVGLLLCGAAAGYGIRIATDSLFVLYRRHERRIVESMKISPVEVSGTGTREDDIFKDIYDRVLDYFEKEKPFLNGDLTINDIVSVVFTNKLYISRAISQHTGRNFCQFVNYHRIMYSVQCFRNNPELKVAELWPLCGFNTIVSYNMAFRLFMGENPSDWCRKEKIRLFRKGK